MTIASDNGTIIVFANIYDGAILKITEDRPKAINVTNTESGKSCWLPKSGLKQRKPGEPTYESEYVVSPWFSRRMSDQQERVLNLLA